MFVKHGHYWFSTPFKSLFICFFICFSNPVFAGYYGGYHYGYHAYPYFHHPYGRHYGIHGHASGNAGYVILGLLGIAFLSHIISTNYQNNQYHRMYSYNQPGAYKPDKYSGQTINYKKTVTKPVFSYGLDEGWYWLSKGNADYALDIFAIQSQQHLNSGIPKIGFAIAAATRGEMDRATRAMRKAIRIDAAALNRININNIKPALETVSENYKTKLNTNKIRIDDAFMVAALSYLHQDYTTANNILDESDKSLSALNLKKLIKRSR